MTQTVPSNPVATVKVVLFRAAQTLELFVKRKRDVQKALDELNLVAEEIVEDKYYFHLTLGRGRCVVIRLKENVNWMIKEIKLAKNYKEVMRVLTSERRFDKVIVDSNVNTVAD